MTDVSTTQGNALTGAKSLKNNNETRHSIADTKLQEQTTISLTNGSTIKINNIQIPTITKDEQHLPSTATAPAAATTTAMSTVGVKSPTPTTQSPATTPSQTLVSYDTNTSACSTTLISSANQTNQVITKPALQTDKVSISPETNVTALSSTPSPTLTTCGSSSNMVGNTTTLSSPVSCTSPSLKVVAKQSREASAQDVDEVARLFEEKPEAFEKWLMERAPPEALARLHEFIESRKQPLKRPSVTSDLFQQWMSSSPIQKNRSLSSASSSSHSVLDNRRHLMELDEGELFMELIRDVANELDIDVLCHKILVNVGLLTHADRGSLFLAKGPPNNRYLVAKLFDVTQKTQKYSLKFHEIHQNSQYFWFAQKENNHHQ